MGSLFSLEILYHFKNIIASPLIIMLVGTCHCAQGVTKAQPNPDSKIQKYLIVPVAVRLSIVSCTNNFLSLCLMTEIVYRYDV